MTAIFDIVVNTDDLVVLASPAVIDVGVDFGPQGQRGATFYAGSGNPNDRTVEQNVFGDSVTPVQGDIYINVAGGSNYGWLYLYNPQITGDNWNQLLRLDPPIYNITKEQLFNSSGITVIDIAVTNIVPPGSKVTDVNSYVINLTPRNKTTGVTPKVLTINSQSFAGIDDSILRITVSGIKFSGGTWSVMNDELLDVSVLVTVV